MTPKKREFRPNLDNLFVVFGILFHTNWRLWKKITILTNIQSFKMRFKTFWAERTIWRDGRKLHPHVPPSGINVQSTNRGVSTIKSKRVFSWDHSAANLHIVFLIGAFFATGRNWAKIEVFKFQLHPFARRHSDDPTAPGIIWVRNRVIRGEDCSRKPTDFIDLVSPIWQTTYSRCFLCEEWKWWSILCSNAYCT